MLKFFGRATTGLLSVFIVFIGLLITPFVFKLFFATLDSMGFFGSVILFMILVSPFAVSVSLVYLLIEKIKKRMMNKKEAEKEYYASVYDRIREKSN